MSDLTIKTQPTTVPDNVPITDPENDPTPKTGIDQTNTYGSGKTTEGESFAQAMGLEASRITATDYGNLLMEMRTKTERNQLATSSENVKAIKDQKKTAADKRIDDLNDMMKKIDEAAKKEKKSNFWTKFAGFAMIAAGALLMIAGGSGAALIAAGAATLAVAALQESGAMDKIMDGMTKMLTPVMKFFGADDPEQAARIATTAIVGAAIVGVALMAGAVGGPAAAMAVASTALNVLFTPDNLVKMGVPEEKAAAISMGIGIGLAVAGLAGGGASMAGGTAKVGKLAAQGSKMAKFAKYMSKGGWIEKLQAGLKNSDKVAQLANKYPKLMTAINNSQTFAKYGSLVATGAAGGASVASGVNTIEAAETTKEAQDLEAATKEMEAFLALMNAKFEDEKERIQEIMNRMEELASTVMSILKGDANTMEKALEV
ncbi:MAG: hypothetical protein AAGG46_04765 [Planctomycetota bacterium]